MIALLEAEVLTIFFWYTDSETSIPNNAPVFYFWRDFLDLLHYLHITDNTIYSPGSGLEQWNVTSTITV
jgi:hypothetical protein